MIEKTIGEIIAEAREKKGLSQRQLAKIAKINNSELSKIEAGIRKDPNPKILRKLSNIIDVNFNDMMYMIGLGNDVSPLNPFIKYNYEKMDLEELYEEEVDVLGTIRSLKRAINTCNECLNKENTSEQEKELLLQTLEEKEYQLRTQEEIVKLIQSIKLRERSRNAKKNK